LKIAIGREPVKTNEIGTKIGWQKMAAIRKHRAIQITVWTLDRKTCEVRPDRSVRHRIQFRDRVIGRELKDLGVIGLRWKKNPIRIGSTHDPVKDAINSLSHAN
jgi:hypothetical protein